jgi:hypothetical protein
LPEKPFFGWELARFALIKNQDRPKFPVAALFPGCRSDWSRSPLRFAVPNVPPSALAFLARISHPVS